LWPADLLAQRAARRVSGRPAAVVGTRYYAPRVYYPRYYYPHYYYPRYYYPGFYGFYGGFYNPYFLGFYGQYPYPYPPYYGWRYDNSGSARLQVAPRNTQVYVDGYFVGVVDDFDGSLQRLNVEAGQHELQLFLEGHRTFTQKVLFVRGTTLKIMHTMQPLGPGEPGSAPPKPDESKRAQPYGASAGQPPVEGQGRPGERAAFGSLLLRVRPSDATVLIDGEPWTAPAGEDQFVIELSEGSHRIEVRKDGYQTYATTVRVRRGETVRLNVGLTSGDSTTAHRRTLSGEF
jgi:hypothetical protein